MAGRTQKTTWILVGILVVSAVLRLANLSSGDTLSDEIGYAFRAVDMLDFDEAGDQTTPLEWFDPHIPSWTSLSFHDHPPLVFFVQYISMKILGETNFGFRLPSALLGIGSVYLLYLIGTALYSQTAGLIAAAVLGTTVNHVAISRLGLQEPYVIYFILLALYFFIRALKNDRYFLWLGVAFGLGMLTKYNMFIMVPVFGTYLALYKREYIVNKKLWLGALLALLMFSPVIVYNYKLYQAVGHFDFQLSFIFRQEHKEWQIEPGKEEFPYLGSRAKHLLPNLANYNSWLFLGLFTISILGFFLSLGKRSSIEHIKKHGLLFLSLFWMLVLIVGAIGPSLRFLSMLTPCMALAVGVFLASCYEKLQWHKYKKFTLTIVVIILIFETIYSINSAITNYPRGTISWLWSRIRYENYNWGYNNLSAWLTTLLDGHMPAFAFEPTYTFIADVQAPSLDADRKAGRTLYPILIIYDRNIQSSAQLWNLDRLQIYHAWPIISTETYIEFMQKEGADYFRKAGIKKTYVIIPTDLMPLKRPSKRTATAALFEKELRAKGLEPAIIKNKREEAAFRVYEF